MIVTVINKDNLEFFMGAFTKETTEEADLLLGVIDDEDEFKACGGMALALDDNGFRIISLYISENKRRLGAATALLKALDDFCEKENIPGIRTSYVLNESTEGFYELLKSRGYTEDPDTGKSFSFTVGDVNIDILAGQSQASTGKICSLKDIGADDWDTFCDKIESERVGRSKTDRNVYPMLKDREYYDEDMSFVYKDKDGSLTGVLLSSITSRGYNLDYIWHKNNNLYELDDLIATAVRTCKEFTPFAEITVYAANSSIEKLLGMLVLPEGLHPENTIRQFKI